MQIYYRNIFDDIAAGEYGKASSVFGKHEPLTALKISKDYLYAQGYFKTLEALSSEQTSSEVADVIKEQKKGRKGNEKVLIDEREESL